MSKKSRHASNETSNETNEEKMKSEVNGQTADADIEKEKERLMKEKKRLQGELARSEGMLANEKFISKAPAAKVEEEKQKKEKYLSMLAQVDERLQALDDLK